MADPPPGAAINHLAESLDTIEADVPYEELIPLARTIQTDRKLREDNETMRREFTANVSHELKTPLTSISGYAELIETGMAKPADVPHLCGARIHKKAQRVIALVSDILQLSELDSTQASQSREKPVEMAPVDPGRASQGDCPEHDGQRPQGLRDAAIQRPARHRAGQQGSAG